MGRSTAPTTRRKDYFNLLQFRVYQNVCFGTRSMAGSLDLAPAFESMRGRTQPGMEHSALDELFSKIPAGNVSDGFGWSKVAFDLRQRMFSLD
jgi:hypothetical protein